VTVKHILKALTLLENALDNNDGAITAEMLGRLDFHIGHPELTNPFQASPNRDAWQLGWESECERWLSSEDTHNPSVDL
jgi:hypothetical protein